MDTKKPEFYVPPPRTTAPVSQPSAPAGDAVISTVVDSHTGLPDHLTPGRDVLIGGNRIKITPDDEEGLGLFFIPCAGDADPICAEAHYGVNESRQLSVCVPESLPPGLYRLRIVTRYSGTNLLKNHRAIDYTEVCESTVEAQS